MRSEVPRNSCVEVGRTEIQYSLVKVHPILDPNDFESVSMKFYTIAEALQMEIYLPFHAFGKLTSRRTNALARRAIFPLETR